MIRIELSNSRITIQGHAGAGPPGQDIVCSAISTLLQTFVASVEELTDDRIKSEISAGNAVVEYEDLSKEAELLRQSFLLGCRGVAGAAPECVKVVDQEGGKHE